MVAAPFVGPLADRYSRKLIIILGAVFWSGLTLMTAVTHTYGELLLRHTLVGVGEATFVTIAPTFVADLFPENKRGRIFGIFYLAIPCGTAAGYLLGGWLGPSHGWRFPFYIAAAPGFLLALAVCFLPEPPRGQFDSQKETRRRALGIHLGLGPQPCFLDSHSGHGRWDIFTGRNTSLDADLPVARTRLQSGSRQPDFWQDCCSRWHSASLIGGWLGDTIAAADEGFLLLCFRGRAWGWVSR